MAKASLVYCAAVDLGATSGRVIVGAWDGRQLKLTEAHRFPNQFHSINGHDYWDLPGLWQEIVAGLRTARTRFPRLASVGVDTWGVDHVLLNAAGRMVFPPHAYRDARTQPGLQRLVQTRSALGRIYATTGIPPLFYNTSLQLEETLHACPAVSDLATRCLLLPDYFNYLLSGRQENEISIASTTQLLAVQDRDWSRSALAHFHVPPTWFTPPILAGARLGPVQRESALRGVEVIAVPGHDTACAYDAMPADRRGSDLYLSTGTWSLLGFESDRPVLGSEALAARIASERTGDGRYRPLMSVIGLWLLEQTLQEFRARPGDSAGWTRLLTAAARLPEPASWLNVTDPAFVNPPSMRAAIDAHLTCVGHRPPRELAGYVRLICGSLGHGHATAQRALADLAGRKFSRILMVGGGARNFLLGQATADASGLPVHAFDLEGAATGNIARQLIALGAVRDLACFRAALTEQLRPQVYRPRGPGPRSARRPN